MGWSDEDRSPRSLRESGFAGTMSLPRTLHLDPVSRTVLVQPHPYAPPRVPES